MKLERKSLGIFFKIRYSIPNALSAGTLEYIGVKLPPYRTKFAPTVDR